MALTNEQILTLLQLQVCGRITTFKLSNYSLDNKVAIESDKSLYDYIFLCKENKVATRIKDYELSDIETASSTAKNIIRRTQEKNFGIVSYYDPNFPKRLKNLTYEKGSLLSPIILYYLGDIEKANMPAIAIIGTRNPTKEGVMAGEYFGRYFAEKGFNIVSGLAVGCDLQGTEGH